uniref:Zinc finger and BTB domain containing 6 n=1 Tax=Anas platyrhynchos TaxID=8839 RepID=A0A8B9TK47_ANAPL
MAADSEVLHFQFEQQGDAVLQKMNLLRQQNLFCDVSIYINDTEFPGHKVIFAACSTFMRDQFLLNQSRQVRITILQSAEVGRKLLLSCYTGALEVKKKELLKYLTAASYLQMVHIVEKCTEALSKYLEIDASMENGGQAAERCHSSDTELRSREDAVDKDCEIIEIAEDSPACSTEQWIQERKETKTPEISTVEIGYKDDEICIFRMDSVPVPSVESRNTETSGNHFQAFCPKCPRGFLHLENYLRHLKMHKLFLCLQCGKTFTQKKNLNRHIRGHMGIRPFQCMVCLKTFTAKSTLQDHLNIHSGDRPYKCHCCDMDFKHKSALKKHLTSVHGRSSSEKTNLKVLYTLVL